jgi:S-formylglutathione hydrolase FrmB
MYLRAGVILPKNFARESDRKYPLRVHIGGYGARFTAVGPRMNEGAEFHATWMAADAPRFVFVQLDGAGPYGDPYYVDSPANGPYGRALMEELLPEIERRFRCGGSGEKRVTDGGSTGGWVSLALQVLHPTEFAGCWSFCPDPVDFRDFQKINIYQDANAYLDDEGDEVPAARFPESGQTAFTVRTECSYENVLGHGDSWANSGGQWGAWNAAFGPALDADRRPSPLWNPITGEINLSLATNWKRYDLRHHLESNWQELVPNLRGKIRIWVGDADDFFLDRAVRRLEAFLNAASPPADAQVTFGKGQGHCFMPLTEKQFLLEMARVTGARP